MKITTNITLKDLRAISLTIGVFERNKDTDETDCDNRLASNLIHLAVIKVKNSVNKCADEIFLQKQVIFHFNKDETLDLLIDEEGFDETHHNQEAQNLFMRYLRSIENKTDILIIDGDELIPLIELKDALNQLNFDQALMFNAHFKDSQEHSVSLKKSETTCMSSFILFCKCLLCPFLCLILIPISIFRYCKDKYQSNKHTKDNVATS